MRRFLLFALITLLGTQAGARPPADLAGKARPQATLDYYSTSYIDANRIMMFVTNNGNFGRDIGSMFSTWGPGTFFPYTSIEDIADGTNDASVLYAAGIWAGGRDAATGELLLAVSEYTVEYVPGPMAGGTYQPDNPWFRTYKLHSDSLASNPNADYLDWPDDQGAPVDDLARPVMLGDQTLWTVYNDADQSWHNNRAGSTSPLGIEIQQTTWAYHRTTGPLAGTIFFKYKIFNRGGRTLEDFYISLWSDPDLGGPTDDMVGCDTVNQAMFCYNGDNDDTDYGSSPPAFGIKVLYGPLVPMPGVTGYYDGHAVVDHWNLPLTAFNKYINGTDPYGPDETYYYMQGMKADGSPYQYDGSSVKFMHSGDPTTGHGDLDFNPSDKRMMGSFGPMTFAPGDSQFVEIAVVAIQGSDRLISLIYLNHVMSMLGPEPHTPMARHVPADYPTIQAAIYAAWPSDTVLVAPGTYTGDGNRDLDFLGKNIVVRSESGPSVTVIDCEATAYDLHRGFHFHGNETQNAVVDGFTITNGYASDGGAILSQSASPTIRGNIIADNTAVSNGGGIRCVYGGLHVVGNTISSNEAGDIGGNEGGGISMVNCMDYVVEDNTISGNYAFSGGGIGVFDSWGLIRDNTIEDNLAHDGGGIGLCCGSYGTIDSNTIVNNEVAFNGGGIYFNSGSTPTVLNNVIARNSASLPFGFGGGFACNESSPPLAGNVVCDNSAANGGGLALGSGSAPLTQGCTIVANSATSGGGIYGVAGAALRVEHSIIAFSSSGGAITIDGACNAILTCSNLYGNSGGDWTGCISDQETASSNFSADPLFCGAEIEDYHLSLLSPCAAINNSCGTLIGALEANCGSYVCGDVDLDGELTAADIEALRAVYFGSSPLYFPTPTGDMDCSGTISINDLIILAGYYHGYGPAPCCAPPPKRIDLPARDANGGTAGE